MDLAYNAIRHDIIRENSPKIPPLEKMVVLPLSTISPQCYSGMLAHVYFLFNVQFDGALERFFRCMLKGEGGKGEGGEGGQGGDLS